MYLRRFYAEKEISNLAFIAFQIESDLDFLAYMAYEVMPDIRFESNSMFPYIYILPKLVNFG